MSRVRFECFRTHGKRTTWATIPIGHALSKGDMLTLPNLPRVSATRTGGLPWGKRAILLEYGPASQRADQRGDKEDGLVVVGVRNKQQEDGTCRKPRKYRYQQHHVAGGLIASGKCLRLQRGSCKRGGEVRWHWVCDA